MEIPVLLDANPPQNRTRLRQILVMCGMATLAGGNLAVAAPPGGTVSVSGTVSTIHQSSKSLKINWESFNVPASKTYTPPPPGPPVKVHRQIPGVITGNPQNLSKRINENAVILPNSLLGNQGRVSRSSDKAYRFDLRGDGLITFSVDAEEAADWAGGSDALGLTGRGASARPGTSGAVLRMLPFVVNMDGVIDAGIFSATKFGGSILVAPTVAGLHR